MSASIQDIKARQANVGTAVTVSSLPQVSVGLTTLQGFELSQRAAKLLASSTLVPPEYRNNLSNCVIALNMASRIGADPLMVMQNLVIVHNRPTWSAQFLIATFNSCGRFSALRYEFFGEKGTDDWGCRAFAIERESGEKLVGTDVTIGLAKLENWYGRNGSKWKSMPQQMLMYRAASWFIRAIAPELSMGLHTAEEIHDAFDATQNEDGGYEVVTVAEEKAEIRNVNTETGEISQAEPVNSTEDVHAEPAEPEKQPNPAVLDYKAAIETAESKSDIARLAHDIRGDKRLSKAENAVMMDALNLKQAAL